VGELVERSDWPEGAGPRRTSGATDHGCQSNAAAYVESAAFTLLGADRPGTIVALHGLSGTRHQPGAYLDGFDVPELGLLVPDLRGHGETELLGQARDFTPTQLGADVDALIRYLGLETRSVVVLGISLGATVALELLRRETLDIVGAVFIRPAHAAGPARHLRVNRSIAALLRMEPAEALSRLVASEEYRKVAATSERAAASLRDKVTADRAYERVLRLAEGANWNAFDPDERFADAPATLIVAAHDDPLHPLSVAAEWQRRITGSALVELPSRDTDPIAYAELARSTVQAFLGELRPRIGTSR